MHENREYRKSENTEILGMKEYRGCRDTWNAWIQRIRGYWVYRDSLGVQRYMECRDTGNTGIQEVQRYWKCRDPGNARNAELQGMQRMQGCWECKDTMMQRYREFRDKGKTRGGDTGK